MIDIDECKTGDHDCEPGLFERCNNIERSYECVCQDGYHNQSGVCQGRLKSDDTKQVVLAFLYIVDINECNSTSEICGSNAECVNVDGSYNCVCYPGYEHRSSEFLCDGTIESMQC